MVSASFVYLAMASLIIPTCGDEFLKATPRALREHLTEEEIRNTLLEEIQVSLGTGAAVDRLALLEAMLLPVFNALPKNEHGNLGHSTVRYALRRLFVMRHGWSMKGLRSVNSSWNSSSSVGILQGQAPSYIQNLFEQRLGGKGLNLQELAVLASTIEHLIHNEAAGKMTAVFNVLKLSPTATLNMEDADEVIDTYMMGFILGQNLTSLSMPKVKKLTQMMPEIFTGWREAQEFVRRIRDNITHVEMHGSDFATLTRIVEVVGEQYGSFQNIECQELKRTLMSMEDRGTGRVKLSEFYKPALNGAWQFQESVAYLRQLGALDESDPNSISVVIPNYLHSQTNCIADSSFYAVCCKDECESLLGHIEEKIVAPEANPSAIISLVRNLPSPTVSAPRDISPTLSSRLENIAAHHGGTVPLHGRLFAQWLHHAFPRECPYPHLSGTTSQPTSDEWIAESGGLSEATEEEMRQFTDVSSTEFVTSQQPVTVEELLTWSTEEELLVVRPKPQMAEYAASIRVGLRSLMMVGAACSLAFGLVKSFRVSGRVDAIDQGKFLV